MNLPLWINLSIQDLEAIANLLLTFGGWIVALITFFWTRSESRLQSLSELLQSFIKATRHLFDANTCRRKCEELKRAFPNRHDASEAAARLNSQMDEYARLIDVASEECRTYEREFTTRHFRFPDKVSRLLASAKDDLFHAGVLVNNGMFDQVDIQIAKLRDHYKDITKYARGWRLANPFEGLLKSWGSFFKKKPELPRFDLTDKEMDRILGLVHKRITTQAKNTFVVHPPKKLTVSPEILQSDKVIDELEDSVFEVVFQDGTYEILTFLELMVFTHQLILAAIAHMQASKVAANLDGNDVKLNVSYRFSIQEIMRPETVKVLLSKITFSNSPSDGTHNERSQASAY